MSSTTSQSSLLDNSPANERDSDYENLNDDESMLNAKYQTNKLVVDTNYTIKEPEIIKINELEQELLIEDIKIPELVPEPRAPDSFSNLDRFVPFNDFMSKSNSDEEDETPIVPNNQRRRRLRSENEAPSVDFEIEQSTNKARCAIAIRNNITYNRRDDLKDINL